MGMKARTGIALLAALALAALAGCSGQSSDDAANAEQENSPQAAAQQAEAPQDGTNDEGGTDGATAASGQASTPTDGDYLVDVDTDSSMFHAAACTLHVQNGQMSASLSLPGEGFSRLYYGTAEDAQAADDADIYDYYLNDDGLYTFDVPVATLEQDLTIAAYGQRRDTWYDHTILFHAPNGDAAASAGGESTATDADPEEADKAA